MKPVMLVAAVAALAAGSTTGAAAAAVGHGKPKRAYAVVVPGQVSIGLDPVLVAPFSKGFKSVREPALGVYCLRPAAGINPLKRPLLVAPEHDYSTARGTGLLVTVAIGARACGKKAYEVRTFTLVGGTPRPSEGVAFVAMTA